MYTRFYYFKNLSIDFLFINSEAKKSPLSTGERGFRGVGPMSKIYKYLIYSVLSIILFTSCEDVIEVDLPANEEKLVVDGQLSNRAGVQTLKLMISQPYFNNSTPPPATGATAKVTDNEGNIYEFKQRLDSLNKPTIFFEWAPKGNEKFGKTGNTYLLEVNFRGETYLSSTKMNRIPAIDSLIYVFKDNTGQPSGNADEPKKGFRPEFYARDLQGIGDCYYIKGYRFDKATNKWRLQREEAAYDAAFQPGARADGLVFILPLRRAIGNQLFNEGDSSRVELFSVSEDHFYFLRAAENEEQNQGLFATPPATFLTNIVNKNPNSTKKALGWFSVAGFSTYSTIIDAKKASKDND